MNIEGLLPSQNADVARTIMDSPFPLREFEVVRASLAVVGFEDVTALRHLPTSATFGFGRFILEVAQEEDFDGTGHSIAMNPGWERRVEVHEAASWHKVPRHIKDWLDNLARERAAEDFLSTLTHAEGSSAPSHEDASAPFSNEERSELLERLARMEAVLQESVGRTDDLREFVAREFSSLREELSRMNRGKWRKLAVGTLASLAIDAIVPAEAVREAWLLARDFWVDKLSRLANPK